MVGSMLQDVIKQLVARRRHKVQLSHHLVPLVPLIILHNEILFL